VLPLVEPKEPWGSRNKTKVSVTGTLTHPIIGIVTPSLRGVDLERCPLPPVEVHHVLATLKEIIPRFKLVPYDIEKRMGELKGAVVIINHLRSEGVLRFVVRSTESIPRIRKAAGEIRAAHPWIKVISVNLQPLPAAIPEGPDEVVLTEDRFIQETYNGIELYFAPQSFMQVTHETAEALYGTFAGWVREVRPRDVLDLFCGVGGFALHAARHVASVEGVELSAMAIESARRAAEAAGFGHASFHAGDADLFIKTKCRAPELVVTNPPRRGLSAQLVDALLSLKPAYICYSSCNPETFVRDATLLRTDYDLTRLAPFDMFPLTEHVEVLGFFERR
jgi:23S rRNA (uracil747-C5)-methyltransferase